MEDVLDLYAEPYNPQRPKINFDASNKQLIQEKRQCWPSAPGRSERYDYEYQRHVAVTGQRTKRDFAHQMQWLVDEQYPEAEVIHLVMDQPNTHKMASLYDAIATEEARRLARKLEIHYTPKLSVLQRQCLDRRIPNEATLKDEIVAWEARRNQGQAAIAWRCSVTEALEKLKQLYPSLSS